LPIREESGQKKKAARKRETSADPVMKKPAAEPVKKTRVADKPATGTVEEEEPEPKPEKGIRRRNGRWQAYLWYGKKQYLGSWATEEQARAALVMAKRLIKDSKDMETTRKEIIQAIKEKYGITE
jgi:hypothetical protein